MKLRDIALSVFDPVADAIQVDGTAADELSTVADLLEGRPPLRRSLSDPSASGRDRQALAHRLFEGWLGAAALPVVTEVAYRLWSSRRTMVDAIERQGVRGLLRTANERGGLERVQEELHRSALVIDGSPELSDTLRNRRGALVDRRALITRLLAGQVAPVAERLASRTAATRAHTVPLILTSYLALATSLTGERMARVTMARPLDEGCTERLHRVSGAQVGGPTLLQITVDENMTDGMNVDPGTHMFESTVTGRLDEARRPLN